MYRAVGMGNWLTDLMGGRLQLPPVSVRLDLPGGLVVAPGTVAPSVPQTTRSNIAPLAWWAIPAVVGALILWRARGR